MILKGKRILVTGGSGFLGRVIAGKLEQRGASVYVPRQKHYDLVDFKACNRLFAYIMPQMVVHSAAYYGGIMLNQKYPAKLYFRNLVMGANCLEMCRLWNIEKVAVVGTACSYPGAVEGNMKEESLWDGACHESVRYYGTTKKMLSIQAEAYKKQYGLDSIHLILTNLYGEWDSYNLERSHVVAALIRKFVEAKMENKKEIEVWGTGRPIREFLYVKDAAEGIVRAMEMYNDTSPINIGTGIGTSISELANLIAEASGFEGTLCYDSEKPDGQMVKVLDNTKMKVKLGWCPETSLEAGLATTVKWFEKNYEEAIKRW